MRVEVDDDGPGMSERQLAGLFDLCFAARRGRIGMGLGLPNARRVLEAHGGTIEVRSAPGEGTTVRMAPPLS